MDRQKGGGEEEGGKEDEDGSEGIVVYAWRKTRVSPTAAVTCTKRNGRHVSKLTASALPLLWRSS